MENQRLALREQLLFKTSVDRFSVSCGDIRRRLSREFAKADEARRADLLDTLAELTIDLQSYLIRWHLQDPKAMERLSDDELAKAVDENMALLKKWGCEKALEHVKAEVESIRRSSLARLSATSDRGEINTRWGNDYPLGLTRTLRRGAILVTTNPPLVNIARKEEPKVWDAVRDELRRRHPGASADRLVSLLTMRVVLRNCRELRPIYEVSGRRLGYVNLQVNPKNATHPEAMIAEAEFLYEEMKRELKGRPNVVFKLPGTKEALPAAAHLTAKGIGVSITLGFAVDQHLAFAEVIERGTAELSFVVMMTGRLDDPIREELATGGMPDAAETARWASTAVIRRSYDLLYRQRKYRRSALLVASLRGPWAIEAALTDEEAPIYVTAFPDKAAEYDAGERCIVSCIRESLPEKIMSRLRKSRLFAQAYDVGGLTPAGFGEFLPVQKTQDAFVSAWKELDAYVQA
ncbi:MAG: transaldolase family protein [Planctomycetota bacterium]